MAASTAQSAAPETPATADRWRPSPSTVRRFALVSVIANVAIVSTGGLVRLTDSGLGCPSWPTCADGDLVPTKAWSAHRAIEFGNRMLTYLVLAAVVAVFVAVWRAVPRRPEALRWAWVTLLGVPAQAVLGGVTVLTHLNPIAVAAHFMLSMVLIAAGTVLWWRTREPTSSREGTQIPALVGRMGIGVFALTYLVFAVGTVVTGSGPHSGNAKAVRLHLRPAAVSQLHADLVMLLVGVAVSLAVYATAVDAPAAVRRTTRILTAALAAQAAVGFAQYFGGLPVGLVELHVTGAACLAVASTAVVLALRDASVLSVNAP
jgi:heme a synthase